MNQNRNPLRRGFSRNGAPAGYGQQRGASPFLDNPEDPTQGQDERGARAPMAYERGAPAAPEQEPMQQFQQQDPQQALMQAALQRRMPTAAQQGPDGQPMSSTGSGAFGAGARLPRGYGQEQEPNPAYNQPQQRGPMSPADVFAAMGGNQPGSVYGGSPEGPSQTPYGQQPAAAPQGGLADAVARARANNFSDIEGAQNIAAGDFQGQLEGFGNIDPGGERGSNTHKKLFGRIASRYDVTQPDAVKRMMADPDFQAAFPNARLVEHPNADLIDFGDGNPVDVIRGAVAGGSGAGWQWGVSSPGGAPQGAPMGTPGAPNGLPGAAGDLSAQLMAALQAGGQGLDGTSIEQLLAALGLGPQAQQLQQQF